MPLLLAFAITLLIAVLISSLVQRTILSTSVLFLAAGFLLGRGSFGFNPTGHEQLLPLMAELALFSVLFTDGMRTGGVRQLRRAWRPAGRALAIGMPLTIVGLAVGAHVLLALPWVGSFLIAAALSPTDPIFISSIFHYQAVPERMKRVLNIESGVNDGVALPIVVILLAVAQTQPAPLVGVGGELALGVGIGIAVPWIATQLEASQFFGAAGLFEPLNAFAIGLLVLALAAVLHANVFLAAFAAGVSVAGFSTAARESFERFGELVTELLKLAVLLIFGILLAPTFFRALSAAEVAFIVLALFGVRIGAIGLSFLGSPMSWRERLAIGWFGPKGFASVVYGLMILAVGTAATNEMAHLIAVTIAISIVLYSSTDILIGRWFERHQEPRHEPAVMKSQEESS